MALTIFMATMMKALSQICYYIHPCSFVILACKQKINETLVLKTDINKNK
jgi:hypothetical protein